MQKTFDHKFSVGVLDDFVDCRLLYSNNMT